MRINTFLRGRKSTKGWKIIKGLQWNKMRHVVSLIPIDKMVHHFEELLRERRPKLQAKVISTKEDSNVEILLQDGARVVQELKKSAQLLGWAGVYRQS